MANPVLAQSVRGNWVENRYRGAICVADASGTILAATGDVSAAIFPRSAIKAMQALPILATGADTQFGLGAPALALACASHNGEPAHTELAAAMLAALDLDETALECGAHPPLDPAARKALFAAGGKPTALHNSCSGKHSGMLALARALGVETKGYSRRDHPVQQRVRSAIEEVIGQPLTEGKCGTDGCSIPTWAAPISAFATGFARMASGEGLAAQTAADASRIFEAATSHPFLVGGTGSFDTEAMEAFGGRLMLKFGADGVYCGALRDSGIGFALKCDDGNVPAATAMVAALLLAIASPDAAQTELLERRARWPLRSWVGAEVGHIEATPDARLEL
ncbi:MAG TPA: asparaginase [Pelagibacterium sp.]|uniref:asparaginase n=1 Tax=Pelagibacterium sp. TaxID=1967288 RepID=UPI002B63041D|nr:asparaginase [Pelagibacterium sp.]HWJ87675.1 asparaginase [Pelagibacterium sp.]